MEDHGNTFAAHIGHLVFREVFDFLAFNLYTVGTDAADFVVLPVSTVSRKENLNKYYDVMIDPEQYPLVNLNKVSYVRTHKQIIVHIAEITGEIGDLKANYSDLYSEILSKRSDFSDEITRQALENMKMRVK